MKVCIATQPLDSSIFKEIKARFNFCRSLIFTRYLSCLIFSMQEKFGKCVKRSLEIQIRNDKGFDITVYLLKNGYLLCSFSLLFIIPLAPREVYWNNIGKEWCSFKKRTRLEISLAATLNESGKIGIGICSTKLNSIR